MKLASIKIRLYAFIVDLIAPVGTICYFAYTQHDRFHYYFRNTLLVYILLYAIMISMYGKTIGCKLFNISIVRADNGKRLSIIRSLLRQFALYNVPIVFISIFFPGFKVKNQFGWDVLSGSVVVNDQLKAK